MTDNSAALRRARRHDSRTKHQRAAEALHALEQGGEPVTFPAIARRAGVSVSLLYADPDLAARITAARDRQRQAGQQRAWQLPTRSLVTEQSLRAELANTKEQLRQLTADVTRLRERLTHQLGADADIARGWTSARYSPSSNNAPPNSRPTTTGYTSKSPDSTANCASSATPSTPPGQPTATS
jgi:hypothetical protein